MASVQLSWNANPATDNIVRYEIERRPMKPSMHQSWWHRFGYKLLQLGYFGGWVKIADVPGNILTLVDDGRRLFSRVVRPTAMHNTEIYPYIAYEYRIRAINNFGVAGNWSHVRVGAVSSNPAAPATNMQQLAAQINNLPGQIGAALQGLANIIRRFITWLRT